MEVDLETMSVVDAPIEIPAVVADAPEVVETPIEQSELPSDTPEPEVPESPDVEPEKADEPDKVETNEAKPEEITPVTFDSAAPDFKEKIIAALDKYDLPQEVSAVIEALTAKAEAPTQDFATYAEYAPEDAPPEVVTQTVKTLLDRQALLDSVRTEESGMIRHNTDKFLQELNETNPEKVDWFVYDANLLPSRKYQGINKFEEGIADALSLPGEPPQATIARYHQTMSAVKSGLEIVGDVPTFIPLQLREAYWSLPKDEREELEAFAPNLDRNERDEYGRLINDDEAVRNRKLTTLAQIQKGIDSDKKDAYMQAQQKAEQAQAFNNAIQTRQEKFYGAFRDTVAQDVLKNVKFSDDPKMQAILAHQNVSLLGDALMPGSIGDAARNVLADAGIKFDVVKANQLQQDIELASIAIERAAPIRNANGQILNETDFNKASAQFKRVTQAFQLFAKDILDQEARLVSTGKAEDVKQAAEKIKVAPKARPTTNGHPTQVKKEQPSLYRNPTAYAEAVLAEEARRAGNYR